MTSPTYYDQSIVIRDTAESTGLTTGALILSGGMGVLGNTSIGGVLSIVNTTESSGSGSGALVISEGLGVGQDVNIAGDATITGNLYVAGTTTQINSETINITDNTLVLNAGASGSSDAGIMIHRSGVDVTSETPVTSGNLISIEETSFTLGSTFNDNYEGWWLQTTEGSAQIHTYDGTSGTFYTTGNTLGESPVELDFELFNKSYVAQYYDEVNDEIRIGYVANVEDPQTSLENYGNYATVRIDNLLANTFVSTENMIVTNATISNLSLAGFGFDAVTMGTLSVTGESILHGPVTVGSILVTGESFLLGDVLITGGNLTVTNGSIIFNTVDVSPSMADIIAERTATIGNNISSPTNILDFSFDNSIARAFDAVVSVSILGTSGNTYAYYNLKSIQKDTGNWVLNSSFVGDMTGITFSIDDGQVQYTTNDKPDFSSGIVKYRALTTSV